MKCIITKHMIPDNNSERGICQTSVRHTFDNNFAFNMMTHNATANILTIVLVGYIVRKVNSVETCKICNSN
jgi:hypothetical protein